MPGGISTHRVVKPSSSKNCLYSSPTSFTPEGFMVPLLILTVFSKKATDASWFASTRNRISRSALDKDCAFTPPAEKTNKTNKAHTYSGAFLSVLIFILIIFCLRPVIYKISTDRTIKLINIRGKGGFTARFH